MVRIIIYKFYINKNSLKILGTYKNDTNQCLPCQIAGCI